MTARRTLIRNTHVISMDDAIGDLRQADILIEDGAILAVGQELPDADCAVVDASGTIAFPGLVDTHNCVWQTVLRGAVPDMWAGNYFGCFLPLRSRFAEADNFSSGYIGGFEMLSYGTTTVVDYCHNVRGAGYAAAAITGLQESGIRHVFTYSFIGEKNDLFGSDAERMRDAERVFDDFHRPGTLTTVNFGVESVGSPALGRQLAFARERAVGSCIHVNAPSDISALHRDGLLGADLLAIHGNLITNAELDAMAGAGMPLCFTPAVDVQGTPADVVRRARDRGVPVVFGCDVPSHIASDMLQQLRTMFFVQGFIDGEMERSFNVVVSRRPAPRAGLPLFRPRDLLRMATIEAARALGLSDRIGSLTPGKRADIVLADKGMFGDSVVDDAAAHLLLQTSARELRHVMVDGVFRVQDGMLRNCDGRRMQQMLVDSRHRIDAHRPSS